MHAWHRQQGKVSVALSPVTPSGPTLKLASRSPSDGEAMIFIVRFSPRPFFRNSLVVVACAMMLPPMGLTDGPENMAAPSRLAATTCQQG